MAAMNDASRPPRLFIPGPVEVEEDVLQAMAGPMIGHRAPEIGELIGAIRPMAEKLLRTSRPVYLMTNSATGAMETAAINCIRRKVLSCVNGAFSKRGGFSTTRGSSTSRSFAINWVRSRNRTGS